MAVELMLCLNRDLEELIFLLKMSLILVLTSFCTCYAKTWMWKIVNDYKQEKIYQCKMFKRSLHGHLMIEQLTFNISVNQYFKKGLSAQ